MHDFVEALKAHLVATNEAPAQGYLLNAIDAFASSWKPAPPASGVDTSPAALRALADEFERYVETYGLRLKSEVEALRAVAAEKEAQAVAQDDLIYDLLSVLSGIDTYDINLCDHPSAYRAVEQFLLTAPKAPECETCNDKGSVGHPPDDYFSCPACTAPQAPEASPWLPKPGGPKP